MACFLLYGIIDFPITSSIILLFIKHSKVCCSDTYVKINVVYRVFFSYANYSRRKVQESRTLTAQDLFNTCAIFSTSADWVVKVRKFYSAR